MDNGQGPASVCLCRADMDRKRRFSETYRRSLGRKREWGVGRAEAANQTKARA